MATQLNQTSLLMQLAGSSGSKASSSLGGLLSVGNGSQGTNLTGFSEFSSFLSQYAVSAEVVASGSLQGAGYGDVNSLAALAQSLNASGNGLPLDGFALPDQLAALTESLGGWQSLLSSATTDMSMTSAVGFSEMMPSAASPLMSLMQSVDQQSSLANTVSSAFTNLSDSLSETIDLLQQGTESLSSAVADLNPSLRDQLTSRLQGLLDDIKQITQTVDSRSVLQSANGNVSALQGAGITSLQTLFKEPSQQLIGSIENLVASLTGEQSESVAWHDLTVSAESSSAFATTTQANATVVDQTLDTAQQAALNQQNLMDVAESPTVSEQTIVASTQVGAQQTAADEQRTAEQRRGAVVEPSQLADEPEGAIASSLNLASTVSASGSTSASDAQSSDALKARSGSAVETVALAAQQREAKGGAATAATNLDTALTNSQRTTNESQQVYGADKVVDVDTAETLRRTSAPVDDVSAASSTRERSEVSLGSLSQTAALLNRQSSPVQMNMPAGMAPGQHGWSEAMSERVVWASNQRIQTATLQLDPPELGSLQVKLHITHDQVSVSFTSPHASVRDAVEQSMPRLREMLEEQGLSLGDSSVSDQDSSKQEASKRETIAGEGGYNGGTQSEEEMTANEDTNSLSLVDYYA